MAEVRPRKRRKGDEDVILDEMYRFARDVLNTHGTFYIGNMIYRFQLIFMATSPEIEEVFDKIQKEKGVVVHRNSFWRKGSLAHSEHVKRVRKGIE